MGDKLEKIYDKDRLLRRVWYPHPSYVKDDMTITSFAFRLRKNKGETGLSVDIERLTTLKKSITDSAKFRLFVLLVEQVRALHLDCIHKPELDNYAHAEIVGSITKSIEGKLAKHAVYVPFS